MVNCVVIDDEPLAREVIEKYIHAMPSLTLVKSCSNAKDAFSAILEFKPGLIFLDIQMPGITGIELINILKSPPPVIFTTAFSEFATISYELDAIDYLVKPITFDRFTKSINKFLKLNQIEKETVVKDYIYIKSNGNLIKLKYSEIIYAQSMKDYIKVFTKDRQIITLLTLKSLIELLPAIQFIQTHRSFVVNRAFISEIQKTALVVNGIIIPLGEKYKKQII